MNPIELAEKLKQLSIQTDPCARADGLKQYRFHAPPFGSAYVSISPAEQGPFASSNFNRVYLCGAEDGLSADGLAEIADLFGQAGVDRYYAWLSPGPRMELVRRWLADAGMTRRTHVRYLTLARDASAPLLSAVRVEARELEAGEARNLAERHEGIAWPDYLRSAGAPGFHHFMAFDGSTPIATAVLYVLGDLGYLGTALTGEPFRGRGAQQALIARRIEAAAALGCRILVSETLSFLEVSLRNLQKAGFRTIFEKEVYEAKLEH
ncbi:MAG TPA: GNAT family N-acetyltransferase [Burkholderiales bacterium]